MMQRPPPGEPFERTSNVIVGLVLVVLMIIVHYIWWQHGYKYEGSTGLAEYFYYVVDSCYNWLTIN